MSISRRVFTMSCEGRQHASALLKVFNIIFSSIKKTFSLLLQVSNSWAFTKTCDAEMWSLSKVPPSKAYSIRIKYYRCWWAHFTILPLPPSYPLQQISNNWQVKYQSWIKMMNLNPISTESPMVSKPYALILIGFSIPRINAEHLTCVRLPV